MSKKKPEPEKPSRTNDVGIQFFTNRRIARALDLYIQKRPQEDRPTKRAVLEAALIDFLTKKKAWPIEDETPPQATST